MPKRSQIDKYSDVRLRQCLPALLGYIQSSFRALVSDLRLPFFCKGIHQLACSYLGKESSVGDQCKHRPPNPRLISFLHIPELIHLRKGRFVFSQRNDLCTKPNSVVIEEMCSFKRRGQVELTWRLLGATILLNKYI